MFRRSKCENRGFALVLALVVVAVLGVGLALLMSSSKSTIFLSGLIRKKIAREYLAESGVEIAKAALLQWAVSSDACGSASDVPSVDVPQKEDTRVTVAIESPAGGNPNCLAEGSKLFNVVSTAEHRSSGEAFTVEAHIVMQRMSFAKIGFGMLHNTNPTNRDFHFAKYGGLVTFGDFQPNFRLGEHTFNGPVGFKNKEADGLWTKDDGAHLDFKKGYIDNFDPFKGTNPTTILDDLINRLPTTTSVPAWAGSELCLEFKDKEVWRYACNDPKTSYHDNRYGAFLGKVTIPSDGMVIYSSESIEVKGIYDGALTVASEKDIRFGGDLVSRNQTDQSPYTLGLIAMRNAVIPDYTSNGNIPSVPLSTHSELDGLTNFIVSPNRHGPDGYGNANNVRWALDIDAAVLAPNGILDIEGLNNSNFPEGLAIRTVSGVDRSYQRTGDPAKDFFIYDAGLNIVGRNESPKFCANEVASPSDCPLGLELIRQNAGNIWLTGGLLTGDFSKTRSPCPPVVDFGSGPVYATCGFFGRTFNYNPSLAIHPPPLFPRMTYPEIIEHWRKAYVGRRGVAAVNPP